MRVAFHPLTLDEVSFKDEDQKVFHSTVDAVLTLAMESGCSKKGCNIILPIAKTLLHPSTPTSTAIITYHCSALFDNGCKY